MRQLMSIGLGAVLLSVNPVFADDELSRPGDVAAPEYTVSPPRDFADVKLATAGSVGRQSSIAVNPKNPNVFVAAYANQGTCWVRTSTNGAQTWAAAKSLPAGAQNCNNPAVTWAPDGSRVYAAYGYRTTYKDEAGDIYTKEAGALVSSSTDKGLTWSSPRTAARYKEDYAEVNSFRLATSLNAGDAGWVYLIINHSGFRDSWSDFTRSADRGQTWTTPRGVAASICCSLSMTIPSIAGGPGGEILLASGLEGCEGDCIYEIQVIRSSDHGATFQPHTVAVPNTVGPTAVAFGTGGTAHLVYTVKYGPQPSGTYYVYSNKAPYTKWSAPIALIDDPSATYSSSPTLTTSACGNGTSVLHVTWSDDRVSSDNYSVYYTRKVAKTGEPWSPNLKISGRTASEPAVAAGVGATVSVFSVWGQTWPHVSVWSSRIASGVSCP